jgi:cold-inducible RNA-binding protein
VFLYIIISATDSTSDVEQIRHLLKRGYRTMGSKLYVGNLSFDTTDQDLKQSFSEHGEVVSATVIRDRDTDRSRGFGFVEFAQAADAQKAKEAMNGKDLDGRTLKVDEARAPKERNRRSGGYNRRERFSY